MTGHEPAVWLLDVDGAVNVLNDGPCGGWSRARWVQQEVEASDGVWPILAARPVLDFIRTVHLEGLAEIRWHSNWQQEAVTVLSPALGLPRLNVAEAPEYTDPLSQLAASSTSGWWKQGAAQRVVMEGRCLIWTDSDLVYEARDADSAVAKLLNNPFVCSCSPQTMFGLQPSDLRRVGRFIGLRWP